MDRITDKTLREQVIIARDLVNATSEDEWITHMFGREEGNIMKRCFVGHVGADPNSPFYTGTHTTHLYAHMPCQDSPVWSLSSQLYALTGCDMCGINNGDYAQFHQETPKQRALAYLDHCLVLIEQAEEAAKKLIKETLNQPKDERSTMAGSLRFDSTPVLDGTSVDLVLEEELSDG